MLLMQYSDNILVIVKGNSNELFASLVEAVQALFMDTKYTLVTDFLDEEDNEVLRARQLCNNKKPSSIAIQSIDATICEIFITFFVIESHSIC